MSDRQVPQLISAQLKYWNLCFWIWNIIHYLLGIYATVGTVIIASKGLEKSTWLAISVAIATAVLTFFKASAKANAYIQAWRLLHTECVAYQLNAEYTDKQLADAHRDGEQIIGKAD